MDAVVGGNVAPHDGENGRGPEEGPAQNATSATNAEAANICTAPYFVPVERPDLGALADKIEMEHQGADTVGGSSSARAFSPRNNHGAGGIAPYQFNLHSHPSATSCYFSGCGDEKKIGDGSE